MMLLSQKQVNLAMEYLKMARLNRRIIRDQKNFRLLMPSMRKLTPKNQDPTRIFRIQLSIPVLLRFPCFDPIFTTAAQSAPTMGQKDKLQIAAAMSQWNAMDNVNGASSRDFPFWSCNPPVIDSQKSILCFGILEMYFFRLWQSLNEKMRVWCFPCQNLSLSGMKF